MARIFDNADEKFEEGLHAILTNAGVERADFCTGYFNLRGWKKVAADVEDLPGGEVFEMDGKGGESSVRRICRLLVGMHRPPTEIIREMYGLDRSPVDSERVRKWRRQVANDFRRQLTLGVPTAADEQTLRTLRRQLGEGKVCVKLHLRHPLHAKLYLAYRPADTSNPVMSIMGSSNLTLGGLSRNGELDAEFGDYHDNQRYAAWFDARWNDRFSIEITTDLMAALDACWAAEKGPSPYEVYLKIMYHLSREARQGVSEYHLPAPFDTELFDFQKTAVKLAVRHLEKRGGAMIGDVVGLGKTITACAVAKFYEETLGASTLVICPPNLTEMWKEYARRYDLKMGVKSIAEKFDPHRERYYRLVIVDESHNLRNGTGQRYAAIKDLLDYQDNKVLLLTATPYNKDFTDLANQLRLFVDADEDLGIRPERQIEAEGGEQAFAVKHSETPLSSIGAFEASVQTDDWRDLMKLYLVRRTRTFIRRNYAARDAESGRVYLEMHDGTRNYFPDRVPRTLVFKTAPGDMFERLYGDEVVEAMGGLALPRYGLQKYIDECACADATGAEKDVLKNLSRAGRRMMGFCRSGFYKRMDSSGLAFLMTLHRHAVRNAVYLYALKNGLALPLGAGTEIGDCYEEEESSEPTPLAFSVDPKDYAEWGRATYAKIVEENPPGRKASVKWISPRFFRRSLAGALQKDNRIILGILAKCRVWNPAEDEKLNALANLVTHRHGNDKVLVFTQYSDTAHYLAAQLAKRGVAHVDLVDGGTNDVVERVKRFSPVSNHVPLPIPPERQTRVLVATDALSEGQNLQDGHIVVNYDLPWAIIRLIQRAGRVDRIGQRAEKVYCYSFFPQEGIDKAINLRKKLNDRINANAETVGSDEVFFEGNIQNLKDIFNEKAGILDEADDGEVDLASQAYQVWEAATKGSPTLRERIQGLADVVYATKPRGDEPQGVITYARTRNDSDVLTWLDAAGRVVSKSPMRIFKALACEAQTPRLPPLPNHHELVAQALRDLQNAPNAGMGVLGTHASTKYRVFAILSARLKENPMPLLEQDLKAAVDLVYAYPMKEAAKHELGRMLQKRVSAEDIIQTVLELQRNGDLCLVPEDDGESPASARIICSMGLSREK